jgi:hypothetical protein
MKLTKPEYLGGDWPIRSGIVESGFAAYAQCWTDSGGSGVDSQVVELLGRNRLTDELLRAGLEVARPVRDRGVDLIAYADLASKVPTFIARPIQMKAATDAVFGLDQKYEKFRDLLIAYVWHLGRAKAAVTYVLSYAEARGVADSMGYTKTESWRRGSYVTTRPSEKLQGFLAPFRMTPEKWWQRVTQGLGG